jgi:glycosyltransferase involved in cell wall biosynthesis
MAQNLKISDHVTFLGYREKIFEEMPGIDIMVNTSKGEGISIAFLEAGHSSIPVLPSCYLGCPGALWN